jgi:hypothetical protein
VNVSNKAELKQQLIRAQAQKDLEVFIEKQERVKARQAAEALQVVILCMPPSEHTTFVMIHHGMDVLFIHIHT